eukprot:COSAG01_NODE_11142_length_1997_cov_637.338778_1_plen_72_part_00
MWRKEKAKRGVAQESAQKGREFRAKNPGVMYGMGSSFERNGKKRWRVSVFGYPRERVDDFLGHGGCRRHGD